MKKKVYKIYNEVEDRFYRFLKGTPRMRKREYNKIKKKWFKDNGPIKEDWYKGPCMGSPGDKLELV